MSNSVYDLVLSRKVGATTRKAVLLYMAGRASDDGSDVWAGKVRMMRELELTKNPILKALRELIGMGLIHEVGKRPCSSGYTIVYDLNLKSISALEPSNPKLKKHSMNIEASHPQGVQEVNPLGVAERVQEVHDVNPIRANDKDQEVHQMHPTSSLDEPQGVHEVNPNHPITIHESSAAVAASTRDLEFENFLKAHPRGKDPVKSRKLYDAVVASGVPSSDLLKAARVYADQQKDQTYRMIAGSDSWLEKRGYEDALRSLVAVSGAENVSETMILDATRIKNHDATKYGPLQFSPRLAQWLLEEGLLTTDDCRAAGIALPKPWQNWPSLPVRQSDVAYFNQWQEWSSANCLGDVKAWPIAKTGADGVLVMLPSRWPPTSDEVRSQQTVDWLHSIGVCLKSCAVPNKTSHFPKNNHTGIPNDHV